MKNVQLTDRELIIIHVSLKIVGDMCGKDELVDKVNSAMISDAPDSLFTMTLRGGHSVPLSIGQLIEKANIVYSENESLMEEMKDLQLQLDRALGVSK